MVTGDVIPLCLSLRPASEPARSGRHGCGLVGIKAIQCVKSALFSALNSLENCTT